MTRNTIGFLPPCSRGPGLSALFYALADQLGQEFGPLHCRVPSWIISPDSLPSRLGVELGQSLSENQSASHAWQFLCLSEDKLEDIEALLAVVRPIKSDLIWLRQQLTRYLNQGKPPRVHILLWQSEFFESIEIDSFFSQPLLAFHLPTRNLVQAENAGKLLSDLFPENSGAKELRRIANFLFNDLQKNQSHDSIERMEVRRFHILVRERFWQTIEKTAFSENDQTALERILDRVLEITFLENSEIVPEAGSVEVVRRALIQEIKGLGPLEDAMNDPAVSEIMVNGPDHIFIEKNGQIEKSLACFTDDKQLRTAIDRMVGPMGRRVDTASPMCDLRLPNGARVNVVLPPLSPDWPVVTIRRFRPDVRGIKDLIRLKALTEKQADRLSEAVRSRANILISGNTGSGKTTFLNVLASFIDEKERIITLEDAAELRLEQSHVVRLETRPKNVEGAGEVTMENLVINALRMRPDRLIVGECRGSEVIPMLQAMNTGHDGSMTTIHANSASDALRRLESMVLLGAPEWPLEVVRQQIAAGLDWIVHLRRIGAERRLIEMGRFVLDGGDLRFEGEPL